MFLKVKKKEVMISFFFSFFFFLLFPRGVKASCESALWSFAPKTLVLPTLSGDCETVNPYSGIRKERERRGVGTWLFFFFFFFRSGFKGETNYRRWDLSGGDRVQMTLGGVEGTGYAWAPCQVGTQMACFKRPLGSPSLQRGRRASDGPVLCCWGEKNVRWTSVSEDRAQPRRREPGLWEIVAHILSTRVRLLLTVPLCGTYNSSP